MSFLLALRFELRLMPQPVASAREVELIVEHVVPLDQPEHAGGAHVAPVLRVLVGTREVGQRKAPLDVLQLDAVRVDAGVAARARPFEGERQAAVALHRHPADLDVAEEHHAGRSPVLERVREHVRVHERAPRLAGAERARARRRRGAAGTWSGLRRRRCRTARTRTWSSARRAPSGWTIARRAGSAARRRTCCGRAPN